MNSKDITVLKLGGANLDRAEYRQRIVDHLAESVKAGQRIVLVHGGGVEIGNLHDRLDVPFRKVDGLRVTSEETLELTIQVLCGSVNKRLVAGCIAAGVPALGLSGVDLGILRARIVDEKRLGRVGEVEAVDADRIRALLDLGHVLVLAPVSLAADGRPCNVNADAAAQAVATALGAESLDFVSDVAGVRTGPDENEYAKRLDLDAVEALVGNDGVVKGGMRPKLEAAAAAVRGGVGRVRVGTLAGMSAGRATEIVA